MCRRRSHVRTLEKTAYVTRTGSKAYAHAHAGVRVMCERSMLPGRGGCRRKDRELGEGKRKRERSGKWGGPAAAGQLCKAGLALESLDAAPAGMLGRSRGSTLTL